MNRMLRLLPELEGEEFTTVQFATKHLSDEDAQAFAHIYRARRKDPQMVLVFSIVGLFVLIPGIQRFFLGQIGLGILYFFTAGLCLIGSIVDLVNYKRLAFEYNRKILSEVLGIMHLG